MTPAKHSRLDHALVSRQLCDSREQAKRIILAGEVTVDGHVVDKPASKVAPEADITVRSKPRYVSRGGLKLEGALQAFAVDPRGRTCLDVGASTGGFTDCLLQHGAARVFTFDVGTNQLAWKLRSDPRVVARERFNARHLSRSDLPAPADLAVIDVSFISLTKILPAVFSVLPPGADLIALIKPQFEAPRSAVGKGGIVRNPTARLNARDHVLNFVSSTLHQKCRATIDSPITGTDGNHEFLTHFQVA